MSEWTLKETQGQPHISQEFGYLAANAIEKVATPSSEKSIGVRASYRSSVLVAKGLRVDFVEDVSPLKYRIEAELVGTDIEVLVEWVPRLLSLIQQSHIPIGISERTTVFKGYNSMMEGKSSTVAERFLRGSLPHPEDLTLDELYNGVPWSDGLTTLTPKADGEVTELLFLATGIYAVSGQDQINKLLDQAIAPLTPSMYQGEIVVPYESSGIQSAYTFVMFETVYVKGSAIRNTADLTQRHVHQKPLLSLFGKERNHPVLTILLKPFPLIRNADDFYRTSNELLDLIESTEAKADTGVALAGDDLLYPTDGLIETQAMKPYVRDQIKIHKLKKRSNLTIDLTVREDGLYASDDRPGKKGLVLFNGNRQQSFQMAASRIAAMVAATQYMFYGDIWEFGFDEEYRVIPIRPRHRKNTPNKWTTAQNIWRLIRRPLEDSTIRGRDLVLMRQYHNRTKRQMFEALTKGNLHWDAGSGRGGDLGKMKDQDLKVFALEPDGDNRAELQRRVKENNWQGMLKGLADYGAEEHERVLQELLGGQQVDSISLMLILTFFFGQPEVLQGLITSIAGALKVGGKLLVLTFNGERVVAGMRGAGKMTGPQFSLERKEGREMLVSFGEESIVVDQTEWLVDLVTFERLLAVHQIVPVKEWHLTDTANLPHSQRLLSSMYTAVIYERKPESEIIQQPIVEEEPVEEEPVEEEPVEEEPVANEAPATGDAEDFIDLLDQL